MGNVLLTLLTEADECGGQAQGSAAEALAQISCRGSCHTHTTFPRISHWKIQDMGMRLGESHFMSSIGFFLSLPFKLYPPQACHFCFPSFPGLQLPALIFMAGTPQPAPQRHPCQAAQKADTSEASQPGVSPCMSRDAFTICFQ